MIDTKPRETNTQVNCSSNVMSTKNKSQQRANIAKKQQQLQQKMMDQKQQQQQQQQQQPKQKQQQKQQPQPQKIKIVPKDKKLARMEDLLDNINGDAIFDVDNGDMDSDSSSDEHYSEDIADAMVGIKHAVEKSNLGDERQRLAFFKLIGGLPTYQLFISSRANTDDELHQRMKDSVRCLIAVHILVATDNNLYRYTQNALEILRPSTQKQISPNNGASLAEYPMPVTATATDNQRSESTRENDSKEVIRLNNELSKMHQLYMTTLAEKTEIKRLAANLTNYTTEKMDESAKMLDLAYKNVKKGEKDVAHIKLVNEHIVDEMKLLKEKHAKEIQEKDMKLGRSKKDVIHIKSVNGHIIDQMKILNEKHEKELERKNMEIENLLAEVANHKEIAESSKTCIVCFETRTLAACIPCGHVFCTSCIPKFPRNECPTCRKKINRSVVLYY